MPITYTADRLYTALEDRIIAHGAVTVDGCLLYTSDAADE